VITYYTDYSIDITRLIINMKDIKHYCLSIVGILLFSLSSISAAQTTAKALTAAHAPEQEHKHNPEYTVTKTPAWVSKTEYNTGNVLSLAQPSQYLLVDRQTNLTKEPQDYIRYVLKPLTSVGVSQVSEIKIDFNPAFEKLQIHNINIIRDNKSRDVTSNSRIRIIQNEDELEDDLLGGQATAIIVLADIRKNDIIDYQYSLIGRNPVFGKKVFGRIAMSWGAFIDKLNIRLIASENRRLKFKIHNDKQLYTTRKNNATVEYIINREKISAIKDEKDYPHSYTPYSWMEYSEYKNWKEVNQWASGLYRASDTPSAELKKLISELKAISKTDEQYISNALAFVQNDIRYLGLEFGENSHKPHSPNNVLENRFGDCKDKSLLFNTLLAHNNIKAQPALVSSRSRNSIYSQLASPGAFDHVISYVKHNNKSYWLDGTRIYQSGSLNTLGFSDYGHALIIGKNKLIKMYTDKPITARIDVTENIIAKDFSGPVTYNITSVYFKNAAEYMRYKYKNEPIENIQKTSTEFYNQYYSSIKPLSKLTYKDDTKNNRFIVKESYTIDNYFSRKNNKISSNLYILSFVDYLTVPATKERKSPFYSGAIKNINHELKITFPEEIELKLDTNPVVHKNDAIEYRYTDYYGDKTYRHNASLKIKNDQIPASDIAEYIDLREKIKQGWSYSLNFIEPAGVNGYREIISLKQRLRDLSR